MSRKPFFKLILASSLILGITQPTHARVAPTAYLCALGAAPPCSCTGELVITQDSSPSLDLCLQVGPTSSGDPAASCSPVAGSGDELCGWEIELRAVGGFTISDFVANGEENLASSTIQPGSRRLGVNWMFRVSNNEPGPPLDNKGPQRIGVIYLSNLSEELGMLRVTAESRAAPVGGGEVAIDPRVLLMPEPSRGALLLLGIATLWVLSRGGRRRASSLLLVPLLLASTAPAARADHLPLLDPETPSAPVFAGVALAALEDMNGDQVADLGIGLPDADAGRGQVVLQLFRRDGSLHGTLLIGQGQGGFGGSLAAGANFGAALASPGDLDGDGLSELAVAAPGAGEIWILFIDPGPPVRVSAQQSIPLGEAVYALAALGDLNGDAVPDLAAGHPFADTGCTQDCGAVSLLSLASDGSLSGLVATLQNGSPNLPALVDDMRFGSSLAALGDLDSDGNLELAVGAVGGGASAKGSVELVSLDAIGSVLAHAVIDANSPGFSSFGESEIGAALVALGDLDASGGNDLAVGCPGPAGTGQGRVALLALGTPPGSILDSASIDAIAAPPDAVAAGTNFGRALAALDIDADGDPELAVGALSDASLVYPDPIWLLALGDADDDRRPNFLDNCELFPNPLQGDEDGDGVGDFCDVCPQVADPDQLDADADGTGDRCEPTVVRLRPDPVDPASQRTDWTLELECGASDVTEVVVALTPRNAEPSDFDFGGGCGEPQLTCAGCPLMATLGCSVAVDTGGTIDPSTSGVLVTDSNGQHPWNPAPNLLPNSLYTVLRGEPTLGNRLCNAGDPPQFLGGLHLNVAPLPGVNPQVTPTVTSIAGVGPVQDAAGPVDRARVECDRCAYTFDPGARDPASFRALTERGSTKFLGSGGDSVSYELAPIANTSNENAVTVWELCFKAPVLLHRIAVSVTPPEAGIRMYWQGCGDATDDVVESCEDYDLISNPESPYGAGEPYGTVHAATSLSYKAAGDPQLYLLLHGSLPTIASPKLSAVPHTTQYEPEMTCVARLDTDPINPSAQGLPGVTALTFGELPSAIQNALLNCEEHPLLTVGSDPPSFCDDPSGQHSPNSDEHIPEDLDGDARRTEDDNCPHFSNTTQLDRGGNGSATDADGNGDPCQCGDADAVDGAVLLADAAILRNHLAEPDPAVEARCSVGGSPDCTIHDAVILQRAILTENFDGEFVGKCAADEP